MNFDYFENLRNQAINMYSVDPFLFIALYVATIPVYYYGLYVMVNEGHKLYKAEYQGRKKFQPSHLLSDRKFVLGLIINFLGWFLPYIYIIFWGHNVPSSVYVLLFSWFIIFLFAIIKNAHKKIISKDIYYKIADSKESLEARKLVSKRYYEVGYLNKRESQKPFEDKYIKKSIYFIAKCNNEVVGAIRLVKNSRIGLPTINEFKLYNKAKGSLSRVKDGSLVEIGNLAANPGHYIARGLYKQVITYCVQNSLLPIASIDRNLLNYFFAKYWMLKPFYMVAGRPKYYVGSVSVPVIIKPSKLMVWFL